MIELLNKFFDTVNKRTAYGIVLLGALIAVSLILRLNDLANAAQEAKEDARARLGQYGQEVSLEEWTTRANSAVTVLEEWRRRRWTGDTSGVIAAEVQGSLRRLFTDAQVSLTTLEVDPTPFPLAGGEALRFRLNAETTHGEGTARVLDAFKNHLPLLVIDETTANFSRRNGAGRMSISGYAPIEIVATVAAAPSQSAQNEGRN